MLTETEKRILHFGSQWAWGLISSMKAPELICDLGARFLKCWVLILSMMRQTWVLLVIALEVLEVLHEVLHGLQIMF